MFTCMILNATNVKLSVLSCFLLPTCCTVNKISSNIQSKMEYNSCNVDLILPITFLQYSFLEQERTLPLEAEVEKLQVNASDFLHIETMLKKLKRKRGIVGFGFLKPIVHEVAALRKTLASGFSNIKAAMHSLFTSKCSSGCSEDGTIVLRKHFSDLVDKVSKLGMLDITLKAFQEGLITDEIKNIVLSVNGTSEGMKANILLSAIKERIKGDPSAFDTFIKILRSESAYEHLADKLATKLV